MIARAFRGALTDSPAEPQVVLSPSRGDSWFSVNPFRSPIDADSDWLPPDLDVVAVDVVLGGHVLARLGERAGAVLIDDTTDTLTWLVPCGAAEDWDVPGTFVLPGPVGLSSRLRWLTSADASPVDPDELHGALAASLGDLHVEVLLRRWEVSVYA